MWWTDKEYERKYKNEWMKKKRNDYLKDKYCAWCWSKEKLNMHHVNKDEKDSHKFWSWSEERRLKEIAKCIVLCEDCHIEHHRKEKTLEIKHGCNLGYSRGCRCDECRLYNINRNRAWRWMDLIDIEYVKNLKRGANK